MNDEDDYEPSFEECNTDEEQDAYFARQVRAANRQDPTRYPCPRGCGNDISAYQQQRGYCCDSCADRAESGHQF